MNPTRCPHCGVMNLSKFVTYPYCAGCGSRLPPPPHLPPWKRPVGPQVWAFLLCGSALGLLTGVALLATPEEAPGQLVIYGNSPIFLKAGETAPLQMMVEQSNEEGSESEPALNNLTLRIPAKILSTVEITSIQPTPDLQFVAGSGHYYSYTSFTRAEPIVLMLKLRKAVNVHFFVLFSAQGQTSKNFPTDVRVVPQKGKIPAIPTARQRR